MKNKQTTILNYSYQTFFVSLAVLLLCVLQGCRSKWMSTEDGTDSIGSPKEWLASLQEKQLYYETFSAKLNVEITDTKKNIGSKVELKMIKGETLQLSVQPLLGIEIFRIQLTPDSVKLVDRLNKLYAVEDYSGLKDKFPIDFNFYNLQALFTNQLFLPGEAEFNHSKYHRFRLKKETGYVNVRTKERSGIQYNFEVKNNRQLTAAKINEPSGHYALEWNYMDFKPYYEILFPMNMNVDILEDEMVMANLKIRFSRIQNNTPVNPDFPIPSRYRKMDLVRLLDSLLKKGTNR